jgi:hypothetical protein
MRNFGMIMLVLGIVGFLYASDQAKKYEPVPEGLSARESLDYPSSRWELARYGAAALAAAGVLMAVVPRGR